MVTQVFISNKPRLTHICEMVAVLIVQTTKQIRIINVHIQCRKIYVHILQYVYKIVVQK